MPKYDVQCLNLEAIRLSARVQQRVEMNMAMVGEYAESMQRDDVFPPIDVFYDGKDYWLADGFHRVEAIRKNEQHTVRATIHTGTERDALLHAASANATHGLRRSNADKRKAVTTLLEDHEEWAKWSDREIGRHVGVSHNLVSNLRHILSSDDSMDVPSQDGRTFIHPKTGQPTTMRTGNIGQPDTAAIDTEYTDLTPTSPAAPAPQPDAAAVQHGVSHVKIPQRRRRTASPPPQAITPPANEAFEYLKKWWIKAPADEQQMFLQWHWAELDDNAQAAFLMEIGVMKPWQDPRLPRRDRVKEAFRQSHGKIITISHITDITHLDSGDVSRVLVSLKKQGTIKQIRDGVYSTKMKGNA